jgi:hypothetical protein
MIRHEAIEIIERPVASLASRINFVREGLGVKQGGLEQQQRHAEQSRGFLSIAAAIFNGFNSQPNGQADASDISHPPGWGLPEFDARVRRGPHSLGDVISAQRCRARAQTPRDGLQLQFHFFRYTQGYWSCRHTMHTLYAKRNIESRFLRIVKGLGSVVQVFLQFVPIREISVNFFAFVTLSLRFLGYLL